MLKVGLTGGIASGKTTVAELLAARGCRVLYADRIAHELMAPGQPACQEVVRAFGLEILDPSGAIDRARLAEIVFADPVRREHLNRIVHPRVIAAIERQLTRVAETDPTAIVVVEAALLIESGYHRQLDKLVVTWCTSEQQIERLIEKTGLSRAQAEARLAAQLPPEDKRRLADYKIDCSRSLEETKQQVEKLCTELRRLAEGAAPTRSRV